MDIIKNIAGIESPDDSILQQDLVSAAESLPFLREMDGKTVLVTGATGLIGSQIIKTLACFNRISGTDIRILALVRSTAKAERVFSDMIKDGRIALLMGDVLALPEIDEPVDYIIHGASVTASKAFVEQPVETIRTAIDGTVSMLELARQKNVRSFVYLSSLEVYGVTDPSLPFVTEEDYGRIDPMSVRSSYSEGKRMVENICVAYGVQHGVPVKIARLSQTFGAGVEYSDGRVFAQFMRSVLEKKDIVLRTKGDTLRNYCYTSDAVCALLTILLRGENMRAYNVANRDTGINIRDMAQLVCDLNPDAGIKVVFDIAEDITGLGYNPTVIIRLDPSRLEALGWQARVGLEDMFTRTLASIKERI